MWCLFFSSPGKGTFFSLKFNIFLLLWLSQSTPNSLFLVLSYGAEDRTQDFLCARHVFYHLTASPCPGPVFTELECLRGDSSHASDLDHPYARISGQSHFRSGSVVKHSGWSQVTWLLCQCGHYWLGHGFPVCAAEGDTFLLGFRIQCFWLTESSPLHVETVMWHPFVAEG